MLPANASARKIPYRVNLTLVALELPKKELCLIYLFLPSRNNVSITAFGYLNGNGFAEITDIWDCGSSSTLRFKALSSTVSVIGLS